MKLNQLFAKTIIACLLLFVSTFVFSRIPVFTFKPLTATTITVPAAGTASVQYTVTNQSAKTHTLLMKPITGISQVTTIGNCASSFVLASKQSCTLNLLVTGSQLKGNVNGGPSVCQQSPNGQPDPSLCYNPGPNSLNITIGSVTQYTVIPSAGPNGTIAPNTSQAVSRGAHLTFTATPSGGYGVYEWFLDGVLIQTGGTTFTLNNITANHTVQVSFSNGGMLYSGLNNGSVYYSGDNGLHWMATSFTPSGSTPVNSIVFGGTALFAGCSNGFVYSSTNTGATAWTASAQVTDTSAVNSVFYLDGTHLYAGSQGGHMYLSGNGGTSWTATPTAPCANVTSVFAASASNLYAGCSSGQVYYSTNAGGAWGTLNGTPDTAAIKNIYVSNGLLYVDTAFENVYTNTDTTVTGGSNPWVWYARTAYSLFVNATATNIIAGTQGGYVYSLSTGSELGFVAYSPINSVFSTN